MFRRFFLPGLICGFLLTFSATGVYAEPSHEDAPGLSSGLQETFLAPVSYNRLGTTIRIPRPVGSCFASQQEGLDAFISMIKNEYSCESNTDKKVQNCTTSLPLDVIASCGEFQEVARGDKEKPDSFILVYFPRDHYTTKDVNAETMRTLYYPAAQKQAKMLSSLRGAPGFESVRVLDVGRYNDGFYLWAGPVGTETKYYLRIFGTYANNRTIFFEIRHSGSPEELNQKFAPFIDAVRVANGRTSELYNIRFVDPPEMQGGAAGAVSSSPSSQDSHGSAVQPDTRRRMRSAESERDSLKKVTTYEISEFINPEQKRRQAERKQPQQGQDNPDNAATSTSVSDEGDVDAASLEQATSAEQNQEGLMTRYVDGVAVKFPELINMCEVDKIEGASQTQLWVREMGATGLNPVLFMASCEEIRHITDDDLKRPSLGYAVLDPDITLSSRDVSMEMFVDLQYDLFLKLQKDMTENGENIIPGLGRIELADVAKLKDGISLVTRLESEGNPDEVLLVRAYITTVQGRATGIAFYALEQHKRSLDQSYATVVNAFRVANDRSPHQDVGGSFDFQSPEFLALFAGGLVLVIALPLLLLISRRKEEKAE